MPSKKKKSNETEEVLLKKWLKKYEAIPVNFCEDPWSMSDAQKQLADMMCKDCEKELKKMEKENQEKIKQGTSLDEILPRAFALVREAARRKLGERQKTMK